MNWKCCFYAPCKGIQIPESGKILLLESGIRSRNAESHKQRSDWNAESKFYRQILESSTIRNPQREIQNPRLSWIPSWGNVFGGEGKTGIPVRNTSRPSNEENPQHTQLWVYDWVYRIRWDSNPGHIGERSQELIVSDCLISAAS